MANRERLNLWADALESGKYPQIRKALIQVDPTGEPIGYCCLGVGCDISKVGEWNSEIYRKSSDDMLIKSYNVEDDHDGYHTMVLPDQVANWLGINRYGEFTLPDGQELGLTTLNDEGFTFAQIADILRSPVITWRKPGN